VNYEGGAVGFCYGGYCTGGDVNKFSPRPGPFINNHGKEDTL